MYSSAFESTYSIYTTGAFKKKKKVLNKPARSREVDGTSSQTLWDKYCLGELGCR